ncbi:MAG: ribosomal-protein-alanine N-acetyltransferase [Clostridiales bacterium]|nr:ribosomal-protein-alanine N-acetyltransferase [Clostridiales bacterium]
MSFDFLSVNAVDEIISLYQTDFSDGWNKEMLISAFNTDRFCAVGARIDGCLIGVITYNKSIDCADLEGIVVKQEFRRKGIAKALLDKMQIEVKESGISRILLEVRKSNLTAISFYTVNGFNQISERKKYYSDGENALVLLKEI